MDTAASSPGLLQTCTKLCWCSLVRAPGQVSELRWQEYQDIDNIARQLHPDLSWRDCPAECAKLFHERVQAFMRDHLHGSQPLLGRVQHHVVRYELQVCASTAA